MIIYPFLSTFALYPYQRVVKSNATENTHYLYNLEGRLIGEADASSGDIEVEYAYLDGEPLVMWRDAPVVEPGTDGDGIVDSVDPDDDNDGQGLGLGVKAVLQSTKSGRL